MEQKYINGDLVYIHGSVRVIEQCDGYFATFYDENEYLQEVNVNVIEGITLTPAILEKNGWKEVEGKYIGYSSYDYVFVVRGKPSIFMQNGKFYHDLFGKTKIESVSDLQHLLFGLGINSEMEV